MISMTKGCRALVTGASQGIGQEFCRQFAALGMHLVMVARDKERLDKIAQELRSEFGIEVECVKTDLTHPHEIDQLLKTVEQKKLEIQLLVNNAGCASYQSFVNESLEKHRQCLKLNVEALTHLTYLFVKHMSLHGKQSHIINVSSIAGFSGATHFAVYAGTKSYVLSFTEILSEELKNTQIRAYCLCPGSTRTMFSERSGQVLNTLGRMSLKPPEFVVSSAIKHLGRSNPVIVPGFENKLVPLFTRLLPRRWIIKFFSWLMGLGVRPLPGVTSK